MNAGQYVLLPKDTSLTSIGVLREKRSGKNIQLSKYKIVNIYWEEVFYPYHHYAKRITLKKGAGMTYDKYFESVINILSILN